MKFLSSSYSICWCVPSVLSRPLLLLMVIASVTVSIKFCFINLWHTSSFVYLVKIINIQFQCTFCFISFLVLFNSLSIFLTFVFFLISFLSTVYLFFCCPSLWSWRYCLIILLYYSPILLFLFSSYTSCLQLTFLLPVFIKLPASLFTLIPIIHSLLLLHSRKWRKNLAHFISRELCLGRDERQL